MCRRLATWSGGPVGRDWSSPFAFTGAHAPIDFAQTD